MLGTAQEHTFKSLDGFTLRGTSLQTADATGPLALLVHGITADRNEGGFYADIANALLSQGINSFRFDLRGHGQSEGAMTDLTVTGCLSDIAAARYMAVSLFGKAAEVPAIVAASFGGGLSALHASKHTPGTLVLLNPNLDFAESWLKIPGRWDASGRLSDEAMAELAHTGKLQRGEYSLGRDIVNEIIHIRPADYMLDIEASCLTIHGTADSIVSFLTAKNNHQTARHSEFLAIDGADHGFVRPGDESFTDPVTHNYRADVISQTVRWIQSRCR